MKKSAVYKFKGKLFRYDYDDCVVEWVAKATEQEIEENEEWHKKHGNYLWHIDQDGYYEIDSIGLRKANWRNKEIRNEYLSEWMFDIAAYCETELEYERQYL